MTDTISPSEPKHLARWQDYFALMKPRVMSLVVFTAIVGMVCAPVDVNPILGAASILAIAVGAGGAGALNMWWDSDIDGIMKRTKGRPVPAGLVPREEALAMGLVMSVLSVVTLVLSANLVAAGLLAFTIFFYAVVYSMWLKRSTPQNIVIGGLAGALPPAVAWAAATGGLTLDPILLVAIIFVWTPPHFWALALYKAQDYASAGVPMMPNVAGAQSTRQQIFAYSMVLAPLGFTPVLTGLGGTIYAIVSVLAGAMFVLLAARVVRSFAGDTDGRGEGKALYEGGVDNRPARDLFAFSLLYLTLLFATLLIEHGFGLHFAIPGLTK